MKKVFSLLLICALFVLLVSCGTGPGAVSTAPPPEDADTPAPTPEAATPAPDTGKTAYATYTQVFDKMNAQYDIDMNIDMEIRFGSQSMPMSMNGNIKMKTEGDKVLYSMVINNEFTGTMEIYSDGDTVYCVVDGVETSMDMSELEEQINNSVNMPDFEEEAIKSSESVKEGQDTKTTMVIDGVKVGRFIQEALGDSLGALGEGMDIDISDITISILTDPADNPKSMDMEMSMTLHMDGEEMEIAAVYEYIFNQLGSGVDIDLSAMAA